MDRQTLWTDGVEQSYLNDVMSEYKTEKTTLTQKWYFVKSVLQFLPQQKETQLIYFSI